MYSLSVRLNKVLFTTMWTLGILCLLNYFSGLVLLRGKSIDVIFNLDLKGSKFDRFQHSGYKLNWDQMQPTFDLEIRRLQNLDNWNVKQLFVYLIATWDEGGK